MRDYEKHAAAIDALIIPKDKETAFKEQERVLGAFPLMVHVGEGDVVLDHHIATGLKNQVTGRTTNKLVVFEFIVAVAS